MCRLLAGFEFRGISPSVGMIVCLALVFALPVVSFSQTSVLWNENWEGDWTQNWNVDAGAWEVGEPTSGPRAAFAGLNAAATVLGGNYSCTGSKSMGIFTV